MSVEGTKARTIRVMPRGESEGDLSLDEWRSIWLSMSPEQREAELRMEGDDFERTFTGNFQGGRVRGLHGTYGTDQCADYKHLWIVRNDHDIWYSEGYPIDGDPKCRGCRELKNDLKVVAKLPTKISVDGVLWKLHASEADSGSPEYHGGKLGWIARPHRWNRPNNNKRWICGPPGADPFNKSFRTFKEAAKWTLQDWMEAKKCELCGE